MAEVFNGIIEGGYWVAFGSLSPSQQRCKDVTAEMIDDIFVVRQRERFVHEVKTCVCGYPVADENEPMAPEHFSQFQFYLPIERELVSFVDRFDYLICCIANGICKVHVGFEERYERALLNVVTFRTAMVPAAPHRVLDERLVADLRRADLVDIGLNNRSPARQEQDISTYLAKADPFSKAVRDELAQLEAEEAAAEHRRREEADRAAGHNPYRIDEGEADTVADEMTDADIAAVYEEARHHSSIMTHTGIIVEMAAKGPTAAVDQQQQQQQQRNSVSRRIELEEDPTPTLTLVLTVKAEEEARKELERRRYERRDRLLEEKKREEREKAQKAEAEEKDRVQAAEAEIARLEKERVELEIRAAAAQRELAEATKIRDAERAKMELQFQQYASAEEAKRLEEANAREARARAEAEKAARRRQEAADREAIAREAAARETRRLELLADRESIMREEAAMRIVEERMEAARGR